MNERAKYELKELDQKWGYLVHVSVAYPLMKPLLQGLYFTMHSWRKGRDLEGWGMSPRCQVAFLAASGHPIAAEAPSEEYSDAPA